MVVEQDPRTGVTVTTQEHEQQQKQKQKQHQQQQTAAAEQIPDVHSLSKADEVLAPAQRQAWMVQKTVEVSQLQLLDMVVDGLVVAQVSHVQTGKRSFSFPDSRRSRRVPGDRFPPSLCSPGSRQHSSKALRMKATLFRAMRSLID